MLPVRIFLFAVLAAPLICSAQHVEIGAFMNYDRQEQLAIAPENLFGVGGRVDFYFTKNLQFEVESAYDFKYPKFNATNTGTSILLTNTELGIFHANAGFRIQTSGGALFGFVKGGVNQYQVSSVSQTLPLSLTLSQDRTFTKGVLYPGVGLGFRAGPLGIRFDAGDEIIWINGTAENSFRLTFGPTFRF
jgi:hypothetical protein